MAATQRVRQLLYPDEEERRAAAQKTKAYLINPFLRRDGSLANPYLDYQGMVNDSRTSDRVKDFITQATGLRPWQTTLTGLAQNQTRRQSPAWALVNQQDGGSRTAQMGTAQMGTAQTGASGSSTGNSLVDTAKKYLGTKYVWGGTTPDGFDCSGLVQYAYAQNGVQIPRTSQEQFKSGTAVSSTDLQPGDLVFFRGSDGTSTAPGHVGMYIGNGQYIQAPKTGDVVKISDMSARSDYVGARRYY